MNVSMTVNDFLPAARQLREIMMDDKRAIPTRGAWRMGKLWKEVEAAADRCEQLFQRTMTDYGAEEVQYVDEDGNALFDADGNPRVTIQVPPARQGDWRKAWGPIGNQAIDLSFTPIPVSALSFTKETPSAIAPREFFTLGPLVSGTV